MRLALATAISLTFALATAPARADELSLPEIASIERDEQIAVRQVEEAHGNRLPQELSTEERARIIREQQAASRAVFERRSVDPKAFALRTMRLTPEERAQVNAEKERLDREEEERRAREAATVQEEVEITLGIDERHPVDLYREPGAVEVESLQDEDEASPRGNAPPSPPAKKSSRGGNSRRK